MTRILKIYDSEAATKAGSPLRVIETYPAFTVAEVPDSAADDIKRNYLTEDITDQYTLPAAGGIDTSMARINAKGKTVAHPAYKKAPRLSSGPHHYIVQFIGPIKQDWLKAASKAGADFVQPYEGFSYIANMAAKDLAAVSSLPFVRWVGHLPFSARLAADTIPGPGKALGEGLPEVPRTRIRAGVYTVQFFRATQAAKAIKQVTKLGFDILDKRKGSDVLIVGTKRTTATAVARQLEQLSRVHGVSQITERAIPRKSNDRAAVVMGTAASLGHPGLGLNGDGEIIAVADTGLDSGDPNNMHPDFVGRISFIKSYPITRDYSRFIKNPGGDDGPADLDSGHGTHTTGSVLGSGIASSNFQGLTGPVRGLSSGARLVFQAIEQEMKWKNPADLAKNGRFLLSGIPNDLAVLFGDAYAKGARIHSNSWGGGNPGEYDEQCQQLDKFVWSKPDFCILFAAGNDGTDADRNGVVDLGSVTAPGTAKNCITVGACENNRPEFHMTYGDSWPKDYPAEPLKSAQVSDNPDDIVAFSSRGPTADGRIKPDVVAPGTFILSTRSRMIAENNFGWARFDRSKLYMYDGGTSMATPLTAGAVGVVRQYLRTNRGIASPSAALLKATLVTSAVFLSGAASSLDNNQGYGRVDLDAVLAPPDPLRVNFAEGRPLQTGEMDQRTVTVAKPGAALRVVMAYSDFPGAALVNNLNLVVRAPDGTVFVGNSGQPAGAFDSKNNVELVHIAQAAAGDYIVQVIASNVASGPQPFALVVQGAM
ncbi:serine protease AprX [Bradyrhizobium sp. S3.12.5]|uniref:S8 family serine peptidase n=1 Tax=Bradyrhizobium sp. S3.12.5 TaxID=3156386 RepID=UPI00339AB74B